MTDPSTPAATAEAGVLPVPGSLVYGVFTHEGIVVLRQLPDETFLDEGNAWLEEWETEYEARSVVGEGPAETVGKEEARAPYAWIPVGQPVWTRGWASPISVAAEVGSEEVGLGAPFRRIPDYYEAQLVEMAAAAGLEISRDDSEVDLATTRVFDACECGTQGAVSVNLSTDYNMVSSVHREGFITGGAVVVCPHELDNGDDFLESWMDTEVIDLSDAESLYDLLADEGPFEEDPDSFAALLRGTGEPAMQELAHELDKIGEQRNADDDEDNDDDDDEDNDEADDDD